MKKFILLGFLSLLIGILVTVYLLYLYNRGLEAGKKSVTLNDLCIDKQFAGFSANFETGLSYEWVRCKINIKTNTRVQDVFEPEGDWDVCNDLNKDGDLSDSGECKPVAKDGKWLK